MQIDILQLAAIFSAVSVLVGALFGVFKFYAENKHYKEEIKQIKKEMSIICLAQSACLNGLHQLGANGEVTKAMTIMTEYMNKAAHDQE